MKFTQLDNIEIGFPDYQVVISSEHIHLLCNQPSEFAIVWRDGTYILHDGVTGRIAALEVAPFVVAWRKNK